MEIQALNNYNESHNRYACVNLRKLWKSGRNLEEEELVVYDMEDGRRKLGMLKVTVRIAHVLQQIKLKK